MIYIKVLLSLFAILIICVWGYWKIREFIEDRRFWKAFNTRMKEQNDDFLTHIIERISSSGEVYDMVKGYQQTKQYKKRKKIAANREWNQLDPVQDNFGYKLKQWVIDLF